jgi:hypothetical protein
MDRSALPGSDRGTVWLADLIEATEVVAASAAPCAPAIVRAFSDRLRMRSKCAGTAQRTGWQDGPSPQRRVGDAASGGKIGDPLRADPRG